MPDEKPTTTAQTRKEKLSGIFLEKDFLSDPRVKLLRQKFGAESVLALIDVWVTLSTTTGAEIDEELLLAIVGGYLPKESLNEFVSFVIDRSLLDSGTCGFTHRRIVRQQEVCATNRDKWRENKQRQRGGQVEDRPGDSVKSKELRVKSKELKDHNKEQSPLIQFSKNIRMTQEQMSKLVATYGQPLIDQELPEAEEWIQNADTPNGRKYRKPTHNHYLFMRSTWLKDKRIRNGPNVFSQPKGKMTTVQRNQNLLRAVIEKEKQDAEFTGFGANQISGLSVLRVRQGDNPGSSVVLEGTTGGPGTKPGMGSGKTAT